MHLTASLLAVATLYLSATALPAPGGTWDLECVLDVPDTCTGLVKGICPWNLRELEQKGINPSNKFSLTAYCTGPYVVATCDLAGTVQFEAGVNYCMDGCKCLPPLSSLEPAPEPTPSPPIPSPEPTPTSVSTASPAPSTVATGPNGESAKEWNDQLAANPYRASELGLKPIPTD